MKHLKIYEDYKKENFKKYFIADVTYALVIFEILGEGQMSKDSVEIRMLFIYNKEKDKIEDMPEFSNSYDKPITTIKNKMIYQSNDLEDCIEKIRYINDENKFNL